MAHTYIHYVTDITVRAKYNIVKIGFAVSGTVVWQSEKHEHKKFVSYLYT